MTKRILPLIVVLALTLAVSACVKVGGTPVDKRYYELTPVRPGDPAATTLDLTLKVNRLTVSDLYDSRELVYKRAGGAIESDYYNMFFIPPGNMLTTDLRDWLRQSRLFSHIIEPGSLVVPGLTMEGTVNALYGDFSGDTPAAVVEMQFFLVDENTAENRIVFSSDYKRRIPVTENTPAALVQAMNKGVQEIFTNLEADMAAQQLKK